MHLFLLLKLTLQARGDDVHTYIQVIEHEQKNMFISAFKINKIIECIVYLRPPEDISRWCVWNGWCHFFQRMSYRYANAIFL